VLRPFRSFALVLLCVTEKWANRGVCGLDRHNTVHLSWLLSFSVVRLQSRRSTSERTAVSVRSVVWAASGPAKVRAPVSMPTIISQSGLTPAARSVSPTSRGLQQRISHSVQLSASSRADSSKSARRLRELAPTIADVSDKELGALARRHSIQRDLDQERRRLVFASRLERKQASAKSVRTLRDEHSFKDLQAYLRAQHKAGATAEELQQLSMELNVGLSTLGVDPKARTWFALFRFMDEDDSGLISYYEMVRMVRQQLKLKADVMPTAQLQRIWLALDRDGSGQLCVGEFGAFMRLGQHWTREKGSRSNGPGALKPSPPPAQGETRASEAANRRKAKHQRRADESWAAVNGETVRRARVVMLPRYKRFTATHEEEAARLERQLQQLKSGGAASARTRGGGAPGALPEIGQGVFQLKLDGGRPSTTPARRRREMMPDNLGGVDNR